MSATEAQKAAARRAGALKKVEQLPPGRLPRKVQGVVQLLRRGPWEEIVVEKKAMLDGHIYHITAERFRGTLAQVWMSTSVFVRRGDHPRNRLGRIHYSTFASHWTRDGWWWLRTYAERG